MKRVILSSSNPIKFWIQSSKATHIFVFTWDSNIQNRKREIFHENQIIWKINKYEINNLYQKNLVQKFVRKYTFLHRSSYPNPTFLEYKSFLSPFSLLFNINVFFMRYRNDSVAILISKNVFIIHLLFWFHGMIKISVNQKYQETVLGQTWNRSFSH